ARVGPAGGRGLLPGGDLLVVRRGVELQALAGPRAELLALADRLVDEVVGGAHDVRGEEDEQVLLLELALDGLEGPADDRDVAEPRDLGDVVAVVVGEDPADHDGLAVGDEHGVLDAAGRQRRRPPSPAAGGLPPRAWLPRPGPPA